MEINKGIREGLFGFTLVTKRTLGNKSFVFAKTNQIVIMHVKPYFR